MELTLQNSNKQIYQLLGPLELRPCQEKAIRAGVLDKKNLVVCSPTGSGKTLVAELAFLQNFFQKQGKSIYIVPLKSLAQEKYQEFKSKYEKIGLNVAISIGDFDSSDNWLEKYDLIITTSEKLDSLIRHNAPWIFQISTVIVDEIHLLDDDSRGPTLEILITLLKKILDSPQIVALSATISNPDELADWLNAKVVQDSWRPVKLYQGTFLKDSIDFFGEKQNLPISVSSDEDTINLALDTIQKGKQALIFCPSKPSAEATAEKISKKIYNQNLLDLEKQALSALSSPTKQCERLAKIIKKGVAFHHAGLISKQKNLIEENFRNSKVKIICCTPTLAAGINLPAFRAIMHSLKRYSKNWGQTWIKVLEYHQMTGRAGRPGMEEYGEAISIAKTSDEKEKIYEKFICGEPEEIYSKLAVEPVLRTAVLSLIATGFINNIKKLQEFFSKTFYAYQYKDQYEINSKIIDVLEDLEEWNFIDRIKEDLLPTKLGKRVSELYLDPLTAYEFIQGLESNKEKTSFSFINLISNSSELMPWTKVTKTDYFEVQEKLSELEPHILIDTRQEWDYDYKEFLNAFKTSLMLKDWLEECTEQQILEKYKVRPGELRAKLENANWLLYSLSELARLLSLKEDISKIIKTRIRTKHGIKEELLPLIKLKNVGRRRARKLYNNNIKSLSDIKRININILSRLIGQKIAISLKDQLGIKITENELSKAKTGQFNLSDYQ